jgi:hypothetical protein
MNLHDQKITEPPERGDCFIACTLAVLNLPYDDRGDALRVLMDMVVDKNENWVVAMDLFAVGLGKRFRFDTLPSAVPDVPTIAGGTSPRGCKAGHSVVVQGGGSRVLHDPHPSRAGLVGEPHFWCWFEDLSSPQPERGGGA